MLVEFAVKNFRSLRDEQRFSMVASPDKHHEGTNVFASGFAGATRLLRTAVIYGANVAGKSNFLHALQTMKDIVTLSAKESLRGDDLPIIPFRLDESVDEPTQFEATFVHDSVKYQYGFSATSTQIIEEWLYAFPEGRAQKWFERKFDSQSEKYTWKFGSSLKGSKISWSIATRENSLFLSTAVNLNSEQLKPVFDWFHVKLRLILGSGDVNSSYSIDLLDDPSSRNGILRFLKGADLGIEELEMKPKKPPEEVIRAMKLFEENKMLSDAQRSAYLKSVGRSVNVKHTKVNGEEVWFGLDEDESMGTIKLFSYAGPFLDVIRKGRIIVVDELNNSLHPIILKNIVEMFHDPKINTNNAQLIFASHGTSILSLEIFRRDQIWFVEKTTSHATEIYPLSDFSPRKDTLLSRGYLQGRYGAVPFISQSFIDE